MVEKTQMQKRPWLRQNAISYFEICRGCSAIMTAVLRLQYTGEVKVVKMPSIITTPFFNDDHGTMFTITLVRSLQYSLTSVFIPMLTLPNHLFLSQTEAADGSRSEPPRRNIHFP